MHIVIYRYNDQHELAVAAAKRHAGKRDSVKYVNPRAYGGEVYDVDLCICDPVHEAIVDKYSAAGIEVAPLDAPKPPKASKKKGGKKK